VEPFELLRLVIECFERLKIPYFVTGAVASIAYGEPRLTNDIDIVTEIQAEHIPGLRACFPESDYSLEPDSIFRAIRDTSQFNIIHPASGLKVDIMISGRSEFDRSRFKRIRQLKPLDDLEANFASPEDVIIIKMEYYQQGRSEKHLRDIAGILRISAELIDMDYIFLWARKMGLEDIWRSILERLGNNS
jgi:hypothetical protein